MNTCVFCKREGVPVRYHHIIPKSKGGTVTVPACYSCECFIHKTWDHNQLRDTYNNVETILNDPKFSKFLCWLKKQSSTVEVQTKRNKLRTTHRFR